MCVIVHEVCSLNGPFPPSYQRFFSKTALFLTAPSSCSCILSSLHIAINAFTSLLNLTLLLNWFNYYDTFTLIINHFETGFNGF